MEAINGNEPTKEEKINKIISYSRENNREVYRNGLGIEDLMAADKEIINKYYDLIISKEKKDNIPDNNKLREEPQQSSKLGKNAWIALAVISALATVAAVVLLSIFAPAFVPLAIPLVAATAVLVDKVLNAKNSDNGSGGGRSIKEEVTVK